MKEVGYSYVLIWWEMGDVEIVVYGFNIILIIFLKIGLYGFYRKKNV